MLGCDLCHALTEKFRIVGVDLRQPVFSCSGTVIGDITDKAFVRRTIRELSPKVVIHTAAYTDVDGCENDPDTAFKINVLGTENVARACAEYGAGMVYLSTDYVFNGKKRRSYKVSDKPCPLNVYGESKLAGEIIVRSLIRNSIVVRTSWLFGPNGRNFIDTIIKAAEKNPKLKVVNDQTGSPTYTVDLAAALRRMVETVFFDRKRGYGVYHITNTGICTWYELAKEALRLRGIKAEISPISTAAAGRPALRPERSVLDNQRYITLTGTALRPWRRALKDYLKTYEQT